MTDPTPDRHRARALQCPLSRFRVARYTEDERDTAPRHGRERRAVGFVRVRAIVTPTVRLLYEHNVRSLERGSATEKSSPCLIPGQAGALRLIETDADDLGK